MIVGSAVGPVLLASVDVKVAVTVVGSAVEVAVELVADEELVAVGVVVEQLIIFRYPVELLIGLPLLKELVAEVDGLS